MISEKNGDFLQWLRGFYYTVKKGSISEAAQAMGRAQSSVSHQIKCLEEQLDIQLFDRSRRNLELTDEGFKIFKKTIQLFDTVKSMEAIAHPKSKDFAGRVSIVSTHAVLLNYLPKYVTNFRNKHPKVSFLLDSGGLDYILEQIGNAEANFGIACPLSVPAHLVFAPLFDTRPVLISPARAAWKIPPEVTLREVAELPFIAFPVGTSIEKSVSRQFSSKGLTLNIVLLLTHFEHIKSYVEMGMGVSIMDQYTLNQYDYQRLSIHQLRDFDEIRTYGVITRKNGYLSQTVRAFRRSLYQ
ncbi:MAG: LysR family transcriptional regulator [Proteobacteria bacterium]|nr:LysR family transcriptional regulator [Pseudomonadota bacterium]